MDFKYLRIGYVPYSYNIDSPSDKRRFCFYAKKRNIQFEIADSSKTYDLVYVGERGDISVWSRYYKGNTKIIYSLEDAYLSYPRNAKGILRGLAKFITRDNRYLQLDYRKAIQKMCQRADAVICSTEGQKQLILKFCPNVHIILDMHSYLIHNVKSNYTCGDVFNFVWEGMPDNTQFLYEISDVLKYINSKYKVALHVVTDIEYGKYMRKYWKQKTKDITRKIFDNVYLYEWNKHLFSTIVTACDMALIPLPLDDPFISGKPENKLILFWRMGIPTIVSATPAYSRVMQKCGLPMACRTQKDWVETIERYIKNESDRQDAGMRGRAFTESYYSEEQILASWDKLFLSVLEKNPQQS